MFRRFLLTFNGRLNFQEKTNRKNTKIEQLPNGFLELPIDPKVRFCCLSLITIAEKTSLAAISFESAVNFVQIH
jgi:hypothetical protein